MDTRPAKRQRRFTVHTSDSDSDDFDAQVEVDIDDSDSGDQTSTTDKRSKYDAPAPELSGGSLRSNTKRLPVLSSRPKSTTTASAASSRPTPSPEKRKQTKVEANTTSDGGSLHGFFQPASEEQRWSSRKFEPSRSAETGGGKAGDDDDLIEDDDSFDELFTRHFIEGEGDGEGDAIGKSQEDIPRQRAPLVKSKPARKHTATKRFLMPGSSEAKSQSRTSPATAAAAAGEDDKRPWAQKYGPLDLGELAVHKRKVSDVQNWLHEVFTGRSARVCFAFLSGSFLLFLLVLTEVEITCSTWSCREW